MLRQDARIRVVLDTNCFLAARWNPSSASAHIIRMCLQGELRHLCTPAVARELRRLVAQVGARPGFIRLVEQYLSTAEVVEPVAVPERSADPEDQKFLECAAAGADYLVSSDNHLLDVRGAGRALVVKPGRFLRYLEEEKGEKDQP
jgi:putative PIN family toxin of toxin-antitoxin system